MVEDKLIIPEEFKNYLNQVADIESNATNSSPVHVMDDKLNEMNHNNTNGNNATVNNTPIQNGTATANGNNQSNTTLNVHGWRNPTSSLYPMSSPLTQPQSPASVISQIMPSSPQHLMSGMFSFAYYRFHQLLQKQSLTFCQCFYARKKTLI